MKKILAGLATAVLVGAGVYAIHRQPSPTPSAFICHTDGVHPDPACTPGTVNIYVTQSNIKQTICVKGWTATIRPSQGYTYPLKVKSIQAYGYKDTNVKHYEEDHFIPLELGGNPTDVKNLWAEPGASPNKKDSIEGQLRARVCAGKISLLDAQHRITTDWVNALK